jgi:xanthine dehydrogenase accessory factor
MMLVRPDGSQAGTLGGGCVEAEVKRRALSVLQDRGAEVARFQLDHDYGWDDGLICGGRMQILIESIDPARDQREAVAAYFTALVESVEAGCGVTEAVVFDSEASGFPAAGSLLLDESGRALARLRLDDSAVASLGQHLRPLANRPLAYVQRGVSYLPALPRCRLVIVGGGHVGQAVHEMAAQLDFDVWVIDDRQDVVSAERFPFAQQRICGPIENVLSDLSIDGDTYCLIVTRGHNHDEQALYHLVNRGARYVGMIGSRRKIKMIFDDLLEQGIEREALERVYAPLGIDIGSQTVPEIAVSICAELVSHRNCEGRVPGRPNAVTV